MWQLIGVVATLWLIREMVRLWHQEDAVEWIGSMSMSASEYEAAVMEEFTDDPVMQAILFNGYVCAYRPHLRTYEPPTAELGASCEATDLQAQSGETFKDVSSFLLRSSIFQAVPIQLKMPVLDAMMSSFFRARGVCPLPARKSKSKKGKPTPSPDSSSSGEGPVICPNVDQESAPEQESKPATGSPERKPADDSKPKPTVEPPSTAATPEPSSTPTPETPSSAEANLKQPVPAPKATVQKPTPKPKKPPSPQSKPKLGTAKKPASPPTPKKSTEKK